MELFCFLIGHRALTKYLIQVVSYDVYPDGTEEIEFTLDNEGPFVRTFADRQEVRDRSDLIQVPNEALTAVMAWWKREEPAQADPDIIRGKTFEVTQDLRVL